MAFWVGAGGPTPAHSQPHLIHIPIHAGRVNSQHSRQGASNQRYWWEIDLTYLLLRVLVLLGLAWDVQLPQRVISPRV